MKTPPTLRALARLPGLSALLVAATTLLACALLFAAAGAPPLDALWTLISVPVLSDYDRAETLLKALPLGLCALSVALSMKVGLWNIGAEGQLLMGTFAATAVGLFLPGVPDALRLPALMAAGAAGGALWAAIPALLRVYGKVSEILSTLMLNYVAIAWIEGWVHGPWRGADGRPYTAMLDASWRLSRGFIGVYGGLLVLVLTALGLHLALRHTVVGFEIRLVGASPRAARYAGVPVEARLIATLMAAGALAGLAGAVELSGAQHRLAADYSPGYGYMAILAAFLARTNLLGAVIAALGLAALAVGGGALPVSYPGLSSSVVDVTQGVLLLSALLFMTWKARQAAAAAREA